MGKVSVDDSARTELTDVRYEQAHWRFTVATFLGGVMALSVMFSLLFLQGFDSTCDRLRSCALVPILQAGNVMFAAVAGLGLYSVVRWAQRKQFTEEGIWLSAWVGITGLVAASVDPASMSRSPATLAAVWGVGGIALARQTVRVGFPKSPHLADGVAVVLIAALMVATWTAWDTLPDVGFRGGD